MPLNFDFAANASVEDVTKLPAEVQGYYEKGADGKFTWAAAHKPLIESYVGMGNAARAARTDASNAKTEATKHGAFVTAITNYATEIGLDVKDKDVAEVIKAHVTSLTDSVKNGKNIQVDLANVKKEFDQRVAAISTAKDAEINAMRGSLEKYLIDNAAMAELTANEGNVKLLLPHVKSAVKVVKDGEDYVVRVLDAAGSVRINGAGAYFTVADLVKEMKGNADFAGAFKSEARSGTGHKPGAASGQKPNLGKQTGEMTSVQKINAGLAKRAAAR